MDMKRMSCQGVSNANPLKQQLLHMVNVLIIFRPLPESEGIVEVIALLILLGDRD